MAPKTLSDSHSTSWCDMQTTHSAGDIWARRSMRSLQGAGCRDVQEMPCASMPAKPASASTPFCSCPTQKSSHGRESPLHSRRASCDLVSVSSKSRPASKNNSTLSHTELQAGIPQSKRFQDPDTGDECSLALSQVLEPVLSHAHTTSRFSQRRPRPQHALLPLRSLAALGLAVLEGAGDTKRGLKAPKPFPIPCLVTMAGAVRASESRVSRVDLETSLCSPGRAVDLAPPFLAAAAAEGPAFEENTEATATPSTNRFEARALNCSRRSPPPPPTCPPGR